MRGVNVREMVKAMDIPNNYHTVRIDSLRGPVEFFVYHGTASLEGLHE